MSSFMADNYQSSNHQSSGWPTIFRSAPVVESWPEFSDSSEKKSANVVAWIWFRYDYFNKSCGLYMLRSLYLLGFSTSLAPCHGGPVQDTESSGRFVDLLHAGALLPEHLRFARVGCDLGRFGSAAGFPTEVRNFRPSCEGKPWWRVETRKKILVVP